MYMRYSLETIVTSFLFLSRVWSRHTDVICDGGRGEGDKWFDGCKWCVCQRAGPLCSSSECSDLVSLVPPCDNIGSRWSDGCYHCKCHRHGIECAADRTCVALMGNEGYGKDYLTRGACIEPKDDRCVCGIDGVPSCTAEVIDKNAYPGTTIKMTVSFPSYPRFVAPSNVYYERSFRTPDGKNTQNQRSQYYSDPLFSEHHPRNKRRYTRHHSLTKRHAYTPQRHSSDFVDYKNPQYTNSDNFYHKKENRLQRRKLYREFRDFNAYLLEKNMREKQRRSFEKYPEAGRRYLRELRESGRRRSSMISREGFKPNTYSSTKRPARSNYKIKRQLRALEAQEKRYRTMPRSVEEYFKFDSRRDKWDEMGDMMQGDEPYQRDDVDIPPSLLVASYNRCRFGVRWYGGSLRCYCDQENSITCGDPSFVASRIDGFRLERAPCEEGHIWEEEDSCRACECQMSGVVLCRRSDYCPLPFLIKPVTVDNGEVYYFDRNDFESTGKGRGNEGGRTDEFRGQEEGTIDWDKGQESGNRKLEPKDPERNIDNKNENIGTDDKGSSNSKEDIDENETVLSNNDNGNSAEEKEDNNNEKNFEKYDKDNTKPNEKGDTNKDEDINYLDTDSTNSPGIIIDSTDKPKINKKGHNSANSHNSKRTTVVTVLECKPGSRWFDGCKRCKCSKKGKKYCDTSQCLHAGVFTIDTTPRTGDKNTGKGNKGKEDEGSKRMRPMQRPPSAFTPVRDRPVSQNLPFNLNQPCGRFRVTELYWVDCNLCVCTPHGPKCTAKSCG